MKLPERVDAANIVRGLRARIYPVGEITEALIITLDEGTREIIFADGTWASAEPYPTTQQDKLY